MKLANALEEKQMDVRIVDRLLAEGKITKSDIDKYFADLPDESGNFIVIDENKSDEATE